ncbi:transcription termination factor MTERF8, chloroplastic [Cicer arietinum]|uniref:Transcription termination factor MTERF8, chloroplastic n=1 Tax=Cicer arietinum TaxID=3827 RepID=A0A1S2YCB8_CICAR|nr:transcription termination factor MTERF8, chloroplastic [Cicer arietinum]
MALALTLFSIRPSSSSSSSNPSHFLQPSLRSPSTLSPFLHSQPSFSPLIISQPQINDSSLFRFQPSIHTFFHCCCTTYTANTDVQFGTLVSLFEEIGISFEETKLLLLNAPELTSIPVDSLRARVHSLHSLGLDRVSIYYLVIKRFTVLTDNEIEHLLSFLRNELQGQLEQAKLKRLLSDNEPKFLAGFPQKVQLLVERGIPVDKIVRVLNKVNLSKALCHRSMDEIDRIIGFLEPFGGIALIVKYPPILNYDLDYQLIPRIRVLTELSGGDECGTGKVLNRFPIILNYSVEHIEEHIQFLRSFADFDDQQIFRIVSVFPAIFTSSRERKLRPRIHFLKECGLDSGDIFKFLIKAPVFLSISFDKNLAYKLVFLLKIGYKYRTKELTVAIASSTRISCENMQKVMNLFLNYGFSSEDIFAMSKKHPQILQYNHASLEKKMKYLIEDMNRDIQELLDFPAFLGYKFDDRIKHRYEIKKGLRGGQMSLNKLLTVSSEVFTGKPKKASSVKSELK